ncbi:MAG: LemA family protein [Ruthenibacterium sp.]
MPYIIVIILLLGAVAMGGVSTQRLLATLEKNRKNAMRQIGVQLSSRFDALVVLLRFAEAIAAPQVQILTDKVRTHRKAVTESTSADDVTAQEALIAEALTELSALEEQYPALKAGDGYADALAAAAQYEKMLCTSRLIYNDSVTKLNRTLRRFPIGCIGGLLGFRPQEYLS